MTGAMFLAKAIVVFALVYFSIFIGVIVSATVYYILSGKAEDDNY